MALWFLVQGLLPLIVFAIVDAYGNLKAALIAAVAVACLEIGMSYWIFGEIDKISWVSLGLIGVLAFVSLKMKSDKLFKFQPVVLSFVIVGVILYFKWFDNSIFVQMVDKMSPLVTPEQRAVMESDFYLKLMERMDLFAVAALMAHAAVTAWAAMRCSTIVWLLVRGVGIWVLLFVAVLANVTLMRL